MGVDADGRPIGLGAERPAARQDGGFGAVIPAPAVVQPGVGGARLADGMVIVASGEAASVAEHLAQLLRELTGFEVRVRPDGAGAITATIDPAEPTAEGYRLVVGPTGIALSAGTPCGLFY